MKQWECWAYIRDNRVLADSAFTNETDAWIIGLGWPSTAGIELAKQRGDRVIRVRITEIEEGEK